MDYIIEIAAWHVGFDEADELVEELVRVLEERKLGIEEGSEEQVRSFVVLKPQGSERLDVSSPPKLRRVLSRLTRGARLVAIPGTDYRKSITKE